MQTVSRISPHISSWSAVWRQGTLAASSGRFLAIPYCRPDLDGYACARAAAEFYQKHGLDITAAVFETPQTEPLFVSKIFQIPRLPDAEALISPTDGIFLVDASDTRGISPKIDPARVARIIDHRNVNEAPAFPNAALQIEPVGAAATLVAEYFFDTDTPISPASATLLHAAIVSNTINFKGIVTFRDILMAAWLVTRMELPPPGQPAGYDYAHEMFMEKSRLILADRGTFDRYLATFSFNNRELGIVQLERAEVTPFVSENLPTIRQLLSVIQADKKLDFLFLTCIDIEHGFNTFVAEHQESAQLLSRALPGLDFKEDVATRSGIIMRKQLVPKLKPFLEALPPK